jgi:hypothetical protein
MAAEFLDLRRGNGASSSHVATPFAKKLPVYATCTCPKTQWGRIIVGGGEG